MRPMASHKSWSDARLLALLATVAVSAGLLLGGCPGEQGPRGAEGPAGIAGLGQSGVPGDNGQDGADGQKGDQGAPGPVGTDGQTGDLGADGTDGTDGKIGTNGTDGNDGADGAACWDTNADGVKDPAEDTNGDGLWNSLDCQGGITDHGQLIGLRDPDHPQYMLRTDMDNEDHGRIGVASNLFEGMQMLSQKYLGISAAAGGDLVGNYPDPTIADGAVTLSKIAAPGASNGRILKTDGTSLSWADTSDSPWQRNGTNIYYTGGRVGIGTEEPETILHIAGGEVRINPGWLTVGSIDLSSGDINLNNGGVWAEEDITTNGDLWVDEDATIVQDLEVGGAACKPGGGSWSSCSDSRLKKNVQNLDGALDKLLALRGVTFEFKDPEAINELTGIRTGMIAQEVEKVFPDWIHEESDGYKRLTFRGFEALAVEALRELRAEKDARIAAQQEQIDRLGARLKVLEAAIKQR